MCTCVYCHMAYYTSYLILIPQRGPCLGLSPVERVLQCSSERDELDHILTLSSASTITSTLSGHT